MMRFSAASYGFMILAVWWGVAPSYSAPEPRAGDIRQWAVHEITLTASTDFPNPYQDVEVTAVFTAPDGRTQKTVHGFWDGGRTYKVRFTPTAKGAWTYTIQSRPADSGLSRSGRFTAGEPLAHEHGFLRRDPRHPYYWVYDDGTRYFMLGQTYYDIVCNVVADSGWKTAIDKCAEHGITKIRCRILARSDNTPFRLSSPFGANRDHLNLPHWQAFDRLVQYMASKGMIADVILFTAGEGRFGTPEQDMRYARYAVARFAAYPNVIWCVCNEYDSPRGMPPKSHFNNLGQLIRDNDPWAVEGNAVRPLSIHQYPHQNNLFTFFDGPWVTHAILQERGYNDSPGYKKETLDDQFANKAIRANWGRNMPIVNDEFGYMYSDANTNWGEGKYSRDKHRQVLWAIYMAGGSGSVGDRGDMPDGKERPYKSGNWREIPEYADIRNLAHFFGSGTLEYWKMSPHNELVKSGARVYVLAEPARQYAVYAAVGGTFSLDLVPGSYRCARFDPRSGETTALPDITGGRAVSFSCPDSQDWVFSLTTISTASAMEKQDKPASSQSANSARQHLIESVTEDIAEARGREFTNSKGGPQHNKLANVSSPVRAGKAAFQHWVDQKGERSELAMMKTEIGGTYWYGWAMYLPDTFEFRGSATIVMQLATYPTLRTRRFPCKANGPFLHINSKGALVFHHQHKGDTRDAVCDEFILADDVSALRDRWLDFVMHAKWTGDPDGFLRVWMKIGNEPYVQKIDYKGRTWWNDEDKGPYFKMGAYMGDPGWKGPPERTLYTDEYRLGDAQVRFEDVAPGGEPMPTPAVQ